MKKILNQSYLFFGSKINEITQRTLIRGPGGKFINIAREKPMSDKTNPKMEDRIIAIHRDLAFCNPNKVGVESNAITRMTPTADMELTMTSAVVKPSAKFKEET